MHTTYSTTEDMHYCACGERCEWIDDPRYEGAYGLRCVACGRISWDIEDAPTITEGS
jgi:hypothetical protein